jgi:peroxin-5
LQLAGYSQGAVVNRPPQMDAAWNAPPQAVAGPMGSHHPQQLMHRPQQMMHHPPSMHHQHHHQQQHAMFHQQQQQMQHQMQQQMQHQQQQQQQRQHEIQYEMQHQMRVMASQQAKYLKKKSIDTTAQIHDDLEHWHEGLEDEAGVQQVEENLGHEGVVHGASIEDLAAAWAQSEAEYDQLVDEDPSNLWTGEMPQNETLSYEFVNTAEPTEILNWMEVGMKHFRDGDLKEAIRSFETELQHNNPDNSTAWRMLGRCHAENDQDPEAIRCLEAAVDRDPYSPQVFAGPRSELCK